MAQTEAQRLSDLLKFGLTAGTTVDLSGSKPEDRIPREDYVSLDPVKRQQQAVTEAIAPDPNPEVQTMMADKSNQDIIKKDAEAVGVDPTFLTFQGAKLTHKDVQVVVHDDRPGQTIYSLTKSGLEKVRGKGAKSAGVKINKAFSGTGNNDTGVFSTESNVFFNAPNDKITPPVEVSSEAAAAQATKEAVDGVTLAAGITAHEANQKLIQFKDSVYHANVDTLIKNDALLNRYQADLEYTQGYADTGSPKDKAAAEKDLPIIMGRMAAERDRIVQRATRDTNNDLRVKQLAAEVKYRKDTEKDAKISPQVQAQAQKVVDATGLPFSVVIGAFSSPVTAKETIAWQFNHDTKGVGSLISTQGDISNTYTSWALGKAAMQAGEDNVKVSAELKAVQGVRTDILKGMAGLSETQRAKHPDFLSNFRKKAKEVASNILIKTELLKGDFTNDPEADIKRLAKTGLTMEQIKEKFDNMAAGIKLDTVGRNIGLTQDELNLKLKTMSNNLFHPNGTLVDNLIGFGLGVIGI